MTLPDGCPHGESVWRSVPLNITTENGTCVLKFGDSVSPEGEIGMLEATGVRVASFSESSSPSLCVGMPPLESHLTSEQLRRLETMRDRFRCRRSRQRRSNTSRAP